MAWLGLLHWEGAPVAELTGETVYNIEVMVEDASIRYQDLSHESTETGVFCSTYNTGV